MGQRYCRIKDKKLESGLARNHGFAEGGGPEPKAKTFSKNCLNRGMWPNCV